MWKILLYWLCIFWFLVKLLLSTWLFYLYWWFVILGSCIFSLLIYVLKFLYISKYRLFLSTHLAIYDVFQSEVFLFLLIPGNVVLFPETFSSFWWHFPHIFTTLAQILTYLLLSAILVIFSLYSLSYFMLYLSGRVSLYDIPVH